MCVCVCVCVGRCLESIIESNINIETLITCQRLEETEEGRGVCVGGGEMWDGGGERVERARERSYVGEACSS
jgi:hypothetical protein